MKKSDSKQTPSDFKEIILYKTPDEQVRLEIFLLNETLWLTQEKIAELFGVQRPAITKHLKNIFTSGELDEEVVSSVLEHTTKHGALRARIRRASLQGTANQEYKFELADVDAIRTYYMTNLVPLFVLPDYN